MFQLLFCSWNTVPKPKFGYYYIITVTTSLIVYWYFLLRFVAYDFTCDCTEDLRGKKVETYKGKNQQIETAGVYDNFNVM